MSLRIRKLFKTFIVLVIMIVFIVSIIYIVKKSINHRKKAIESNTKKINENKNNTGYKLNILNVKKRLSNEQINLNEDLNAAKRPLLNVKNFQKNPIVHLTSLNQRTPDFIQINDQKTVYNNKSIPYIIPNDLNLSNHIDSNSKSTQDILVKKIDKSNDKRTMHGTENHLKDIKLNTTPVINRRKSIRNRKRK